MKFTKLFVIFSSSLIVTGCASIAGDNTRQVCVKSDPPGATILVDNQKFGSTPATITLPSYIYGGKSVTLRKTGYEEQTKMVNSKFQPVALFNILFWPGFIVDAATGNIVKIDPANRNLNYQFTKQHAVA